MLATIQPLLATFIFGLVIVGILLWIFQNPFSTLLTALLLTVLSVVGMLSEHREEA
jgi:hypothetical protein